MKKLIFILALFYFVIGYGCSKKSHLTGCDCLKLSCSQQFKCYKNLLKDGSLYLYLENNYCDRNKSIDCIKQEIKNGNKEARKLFLDFYKSRFEKKGANPTFHKEVREVFFDLYGEDSFLFAMDLASKTKYQPYGSDYEDGTEGNIGLRIIEELIPHLILKVGEYETLWYYLYVDDYKNRTCEYSNDEENGAYNFYLCELKKAWAEGIIVLKEPDHDRKKVKK